MSARPEVRDAWLGLIGLCVDDPELFFVEVLRVKKLRRWQQRVCSEIKIRLRSGNFRFAVHIRSCHGAGKTWFVAGLLLWFMATRADARGLTTAPTWRQVLDTLWRDVDELYRGSLLAGRFGRMLSDKFDMGGTWFASGVASDHMETIEGQHSPTAAIRIVDEAKAVEQAVFDATQGIFTSPETLDVWISTPSIQSGPFYERDMRDDPSLIRVVVDVDELISDPNIEEKDRAGFAAWKSECLASWGAESAEYLSRVMALYADNAEGALFPSSWIEKAMAADFDVAAPLLAGMDVAGSVDGDENAVALVAGPDFADRLHVRSIDSWKERDTMVSKGRALSIAKPVKAPLRVDVIGLGKGVGDALRQDGYRTEEYRASSAPRQADRFSNRKAEDAWYVRDLLEKGLIRLPQNQQLRAQLAAMKYEILTSGKIRVVDPPDSPDLADAVLIACSGRRRGKGFFAAGDAEDRFSTTRDLRAF